MKCSPASPTRCTAVDSKCACDNFDPKPVEDEHWVGTRNSQCVCRFNITFKGWSVFCNHQLSLRRPAVTKVVSLAILGPLIVEQREKLRAKVLVRALQDHPDQCARPVLLYLQLDEQSQGWILATSSPCTHLPSPMLLWKVRQATGVEAGGGGG